MRIQSPVRSLHAEGPNAFSSKQIKEVEEGNKSARHNHLAENANLPSSAHPASVARLLPVESGSQGSSGAQAGLPRDSGGLARSRLEAPTGGRSFRGSWEGSGVRDGGLWLCVAGAGVGPGGQGGLW